MVAPEGASDIVRQAGQTETNLLQLCQQSVSLHFCEFHQRWPDAVPSRIIAVVGDNAFQCGNHRKMLYTIANCDQLLLQGFCIGFLPMQVEIMYCGRIDVRSGRNAPCAAILQGLQEKTLTTCENTKIVRPTWPGCISHDMLHQAPLRSTSRSRRNVLKVSSPYKTKITLSSSA